MRAPKGLAEICVAYGVPLVSGKDSMKNDAVVGGRRISIPPTLLASAIALVDDVRRAVTLEAGEAGTVLLVAGETRDELGASEWAANAENPHATEQFHIADERSAGEAADRIRRLGYEPVWKDWDVALTT